MTFEATTAPATALDLRRSEDLTICDLNGPERFLVWGMRWRTSQHEDVEFADLCLRDSFERAGLQACLPGFRTFVDTVQGDPEPCPPSARLGCWRIREPEARMLHAVACLQADRFGDAWHALVRVCSRQQAARAMLALGEIADSLSQLQARIRPWDGTRERS